MRKYRNRKVAVDGIVYDSAKEAKRHRELLLLAKAGKIQDLQRQVKFVLIPTQKGPDRIGPKGGVKPGKVLERELAYIADFVYTENGNRVVEDVKGFRTPEYRIKRKLMLYIHGVIIKET